VSDPLICDVCGEKLNEDWSCPNDSDPNHDRIQDELWDEAGARE
jgi:hypothetical protein